MGRLGDIWKFLSYRNMDYFLVINVTVLKELINFTTQFQKFIPTPTYNFIISFSLYLFLYYKYKF